MRASDVEKLFSYRRLEVKVVSKLRTIRRRTQGLVESRVPVWHA